MAEQTGLRNNALHYPIYGCPWGVTFPLLDADGDPISPSSPDSEISKNGDTFADCTNEAVEIASTSGVCYLLLTATEMTADVVTVRVQSTGAKTTILTFYPRKLPVYRTGTSQAGAVGTITLDASASAVDNHYRNLLIVATIDTLVEARICSSYNGTTKVASVIPNWNVAPDSDDTFVIYLVEGWPGNIDEVQVDVDALASALTTVGANVSAALADTNELQTDWADGGRLDVILDARASQTSITSLSSQVTAVDSVVDTIALDVEDIHSKNDILFRGTIATRTSQTVFTLDSGASTDLSAYVDCEIIVIDQTNTWQTGTGIVNAYTTGREVTLRTDTFPFTTAVGDFIVIKANRSLKPQVDGRYLQTSTGGGAAVDWGNVLNATASVELTNTEILSTDVTGLIATNGVTAASLAADAIAEINATVDLALTDIFLHKLFASDYDPVSEPGVATAWANILVENDVGVPRFTANALENVPTAAAIATAVHNGTVINGTVESTGTTTTNIVIKTIDIALSGTNQLKGRIILFKTDTTTAALRGQGAPIDSNTTTAIVLAAGDALNTVPAEDDSFTVV